MVACVLFLVFGLYPSEQQATVKANPISPTEPHPSPRSLPPAASNTAVHSATAQRPPDRGLLLPSAPLPEPTRRAPLGGDADDEIALFDNNLARLKSSEHLFRNEQAQRLFDEQKTKRLNAELMELSAGFPFTARAHVLCTASICEVQWHSAEALETLIPELVPWLLTQASYAVAERAEPVESDVDVTRALRLLLPNGPSEPGLASRDGT